MWSKIALIDFCFLFLIMSNLRADTYIELQVVSEKCNIYKDKQLNSKIIATAEKNDRLMAKDAGEWWQILLNNKYNPDQPNVGYIPKNANEVVSDQTMDINPNPSTIGDFIRTTRAYKKSDAESQKLMLGYAVSLEAGDYKSALVQFTNIDVRLSGIITGKPDTTEAQKEQVIGDLLSLHNFFLHKYYLVVSKDLSIQNQLFKNKYDLIYRSKNQEKIKNMIELYENEYPQEINNLKTIRQQVLNEIKLRAIK